MLGLGSGVSKGSAALRAIVKDGLVLRHDYKDRPVEPVSSGAAYFDQSANDSISMGDPDNLSFGEGSLSVSCWANSSQTGATRFTLAKKANSAVAGAGYSLYLGNTGQDWVFNVADGEDSKTVFLNLNSNPNQWYHLCGTFDGVSKTLRMYLDGVLVNSGTNTNIGNIDTTQPFQIGKAGTITGSDWDGYVCNVGVWSAVLTQAQVKSIMHKDYAGLSASEKEDLVSWWNLDSVIDSVGASTAVYDNHYAGGSKLGTELVTDGSFANGIASWNEDFTATLSGSSIVFENDTDYVFQNISYADGEVYAFTFEGTGDIRSRIGYAGTATTRIPMTLPATIYRLVDSNAERIQVYGASDDSSATLTSISVKLVNGNTGTLS